MNKFMTRRAVIRAASSLAAFATLGGTSFSAPPGKAGPKREIATFAAGCFWSMDAIFNQLKGVDKAVPGYAGGTLRYPSYEQVLTGTTGHAESLNITYDPKQISYAELLDVLLTIRNPTTLNQQGPDIGPQYRSIIFYRNAQQKAEAEAAIARFTKARVWNAPIVTEIQPFSGFYRAEDYHIDYYNRNPNQSYCRAVVGPEIAEFRHKFAAKLKK